MTNTNDIAARDDANTATENAAPAPATIRIPAWALDIARERLAKLHTRAARAAAKVGAPVPAAPSLVVVRETEYRACTNPECRSTMGAAWLDCTNCGAPTRVRRDAEVMIDGDRPVVAGWTLLAVVQAAPIAAEGCTTTNIIRRVPGAADDTRVDLRAYEAPEVATRCEHCNTNRRRTDTFVLVHDDGTVRQVGRQCLAAFLGVDPVALIARLGWLDVIASDDDGESYGGSRAPEVADVGEFLAWCAAHARLNGFRTRKAAEVAGTQSTGDVAWSFAVPPFKPSPEYRRERAAHTPTDADKERAAAAIEWARGLAGDSEFERNLRTLASSKYVDGRSTGIAAYIIGGYAKHLGEQAERKERAPSRHVGTVGDKIGPVEVVIERMWSSDGRYGTTTMCVMRADDGAVYTWYASGVPGFDVGDRVSLKGAIKAHTDYKGTAQTQLTRCKWTKAEA